MSWNDFLLPIRPSAKTRKYQKETNFQGKYIGMIPLVWDPLAIHKKSQTFENQMEELNLDPEITQVKTRKSIFLVKSILYYLFNQAQKFYPVYKYDDHLPFTQSDLKDCFSTWLADLGYNKPQFRYFRIYKMKGFHLFAVLLENSIPKLNLKEGWKSESGLPMLHLKDGELVNSMMKVSQTHYQQKKRILESSGTYHSLWDSPLLGYVMDDDQVFPFEITYEKVIATLSNTIDLDSKNNQDLYFQVTFDQNESSKADKIFEKARKKRKLNPDLF